MAVSYFSKYIFMQLFHWMMDEEDVELREVVVVSLEEGCYHFTMKVMRVQVVSPLGVVDEEVFVDEVDLLVVVEEGDLEEANRCLASISLSVMCRKR